MDLFQFLSRNSSRSRRQYLSIRTSRRSGFNSSVGILLVHAPVHRGLCAGNTEFQFLSRNSSRSRTFATQIYAGNPTVSIPQSEFFSFTPNAMPRRIPVNSRVSIPQSEFFSFTPWCKSFHKEFEWRFNSSVGILLVHACLCIIFLILY